MNGIVPRRPRAVASDRSSSGHPGQETEGWFNRRPGIWNQRYRITLVSSGYQRIRSRGSVPDLDTHRCAKGIKRDFQSPAQKRAESPPPLVQITVPKRLAGEQAARLPLRGNDLDHSSPTDLVAPTVVPAVLSESFARGPRSRPNPGIPAPIQPRSLLSFRPPQAIVARV